MSAQNGNTILVAGLTPVIKFDNPARRTVLRADIENVGSAAFTGWKVFARATDGAPLRDITPPAPTTADGYRVVVPSAVNPGTLAAGANVQLALNASMWREIEIHFSGANAIARA